MERGVLFKKKDFADNEKIMKGRRKEGNVLVQYFSDDSLFWCSERQTSRTFKKWVELDQDYVSEKKKVNLGYDRALAHVQEHGDGSKYPPIKKGKKRKSRKRKRKERDEDEEGEQPKKKKRKHSHSSKKKKKKHKKRKRRKKRKKEDEEFELDEEESDEMDEVEEKTSKKRVYRRSRKKRLKPISEREEEETTQTTATEAKTKQRRRKRPKRPPEFYTDEEIVEFKKELEGFVKMKNVQQIKSWLKKISLRKITVDQFRNSQLGLMVNKLRKQVDNPEVRELSKQLLVKWRSTVQSGQSQKETQNQRKPESTTVPIELYDEEVARIVQNNPTGEKGRDKAIKLLSTSLLKSLNIKPQEAVKLTMEIEKEMINHFQDCSSQAYARQMRVLYKNCKEEEFAGEILSGKIAKSALPLMLPDNMGHAEARRTRELLKQKKMAQRILIDTRNSRKEGAVACPKCHSGNTTWNQVQDRGGDEAMTVRCLCLACDNKWKL